MGKGGDAPTPPDFNSLIGAQSQANLNQFNAGLLGSRVNSNTPYGSTTWQRPPGLPPPTYDPSLNGGPGVVTNPTPTGKTPVPGTVIPTGMVKPMEDGGEGDTPGGNPAGSDPGSIAGDNGSSNAPGSAGNPGSGNGPAGGQNPNDAALDASMPGGTGRGFSLPPFNPDQFGPWTVNQTLNPAQQKLLDQSTTAAAGRNDIAQNAVNNFSGFNPISGPDYNANSRNQAQDALYQRQTQYLDPQWQQAQQNEEQKLLAEGFNRQDPAFQQDMNNLAMQKQKAYGDARDSAIVGGGTEASGELARALSSKTFDAQQRDAALNDAYRQMGLTTGPQLPGQPNGTQGGGAPAGIDLTGAAQQGFGNQVGAWSAGQAANSNMWSGLLGSIASIAPYFMAA